MGKEWLYWGSSKSAKRGRFAREENEAPSSGCMCAVLQLFDLNHFQFALHQQQSFQPDAFLQEEPIVLKGVEAPRNSLELVEPSMGEAASLSSTRKDADLNIPVGIQIKTRCDNKSPRESTSECSSSPGTKTPSLVARLMGLDLLPEGGGSPSISSSRHSTSNPSVKSRLHHQAQNRHEDRARHLLEIKSSTSKSYIDKNSSGTRSLPETPRISSARRSDVDQRLSLQINKENIGEEFDLSAYIARKVARRREARQEDENRSPGHYARQIVKQVKESVSRKVGIDITNTIMNRGQQANNEHEHLVLLKPKKPSRVVLTMAGDEFSPSKKSTSSCSPRLRFSDTKNKPVQTFPSKNQTSHSPKFSSSSRSSLVSPADNHSPHDKIPLQPRPNVQLPEQQSKQQEKSTQKCEKVSSERYSSRLKKPPQASDAIRNKREDPFVRSPSKSKVNNHTDKMCKKTPLSNELLNNNVPTLLPVKKDPSPPGTKLIHKQVYDYAHSSKRSTQLPSCSSQSYNQEATTHILAVPENSQDKCNGATTSGNEAEYEYIQRILKRTGIDRSTLVSLAKWYTPTHPLDPAIFYHIELFHHTYTTIFTAKSSKLNQRWNRKLIFQLADELLADILKPYINFKPWVTPPFARHYQMYGSELIDTLCSRIETFPSANCQVLEDIDALIDKDLRESQMRRSNPFEEEGETIVSEIERDIVDSLVHETTMVVFGMARPYSGTTV